MTMNYKVIIGKRLSHMEEERVKGIMGRTFAEVDAIYNKWNPGSELSHLNRLHAGEQCVISPQLCFLLAQSQKIVILSHGLFDPTVAPLQQIWKEYLSQGTPPSDEAIAMVAPAVGWDKIHFENGKFHKDHNMTSIDLGGIAKGFSVDLLVERLNAEGYENVFVEWGGEIRASGQHPEKRPWKIFISHLGNDDPSSAIDFVDLYDTAIATSGDYQQHWTVYAPDGQETTYTHIVNPKTLEPLKKRKSGISSATVLAPTCMLADSLATVAMMFPTIEEAEEWAQSISENDSSIRFWLVSKSSAN